MSLRTTAICRRLALSCAAGLFLLLQGCGRPSAKDARALAACATEELSKVQVKREIQSQVVRVSSGEGWGTAFVLAEVDASGNPLLVTNYHVVADNAAMQAEYAGENGNAIRLGVEVVKVDPENDLALISAPGISRNGLALSDVPETGQEVAAAGYPYVPGQQRPEMTFEAGAISGVQSIEGTEYIQTNVNFNPGNSGGPVVNACGYVVGVVRGVSLGVSRVGIVIPARRVMELIQRYRTDGEATVVAAQRRIGDLLDSVQFRNASQALAYFSRAFMDQRVRPVFEQSLKRGVDRMLQANRLIDSALKQKGLDPAGLSNAERVGLLVRVVPKEEMFAVRLAIAVKNRETDLAQGLQQFLARYVSELFGDLRSWKVERIDRASKRQAMAYLKTESTDFGTSYVVLNLGYERGDWMVDGIEYRR